MLDTREGIIHLGCWAHVRRKFIEVINAAGKNKKPGKADKALSYIKYLYSIEEEAEKNNLSADEIYRKRQEESKPKLGEFKEWLDENVLKTPPESLLGKAFHYTLSQWHRLINYLDNGILKMDNNLVENAIRPLAIGRKNWLFSATPGGASASAALYSLVETAKMNGLEPYRYLSYLFGKLPFAQTNHDYEHLLPYNLNPKEITPFFYSDLGQEN